MKRSAIVGVVMAGLVTVGWTTVTGAQDVIYKLPPKAAIDVLDAAPPPMVVVSPARDRVLIVHRRSMPPISELAQPMLRLAGQRVNPRTSGPHRAPDGVKLVLRRIADGEESVVTAPPDASLQPLGFAPDGKRFAFAATRADRIELWLADSASGRAEAVTGVALNGSLIGDACDWSRDSRGLLCAAVPARRGPMPEAPAAPRGPNVQETAGKPAPVRTYQDLLTSAHDEALFEYFGTAQIVFVDAATRRAEPVGTPGLLAGARLSPDGQFVLAERVKRPFSRLVPSNDFPRDFEVWRRDGTMVRTVASLPLADAVPMNGVITGPRGVRWNAAAPATLVWVEALDGGDPKTKVPHRDRLLSLGAPFSAEPTEVMRTEYRAGPTLWTDKGLALITEMDRARRWTRTWLLAEGQPPRKVFDRSMEDAYRNPGMPIRRPGVETVLQSGTAIFLSGQGASPEGDRPFLDRLDLTTLQSSRLFRSEANTYETVAGLLSDDASRVVTRFETPTTPPNYYVRALPGTTRTALTSFADPAPQLRGITKRLLTYKRADGVALSATLYLPPGYTAGTRLPMFVWAYPREFTDPDAAGQVVGAPGRFTTIGGASHLLLLTQGYAILDGPTMPIVGAGESANDTYVDQLVASAKAAIDAVVEMGVADRDRIGVGGHSYGAFMTANLLAHSDLFRAGIARSGAYNRTLTPFGFQNEQRTFWEVPDVYARMSPFWYVPKVNEPILLTHGEADNNSGTFPIQSERLYMALKGHGATVRYVTLPHEAHGYAARESVLHTVAEMIEWMDRYVKNAPARGTQ